MGIEFERAFERTGLPDDHKDSYRQGWNDSIDFLCERRGTKQIPGDDGRGKESIAFAVGLLCLILWASFTFIYGFAYFNPTIYPNLRPFSELAPYVIGAFIINIWCARVWWKSAGKTQDAWNARWGKKLDV